MSTNTDHVRSRRRRRPWVIGIALAASAVLLPALPAAAAPTTYYVDCSASTNGNGSEPYPLNSMPAANAVTLSPGDTMLFKRGSTCKGQMYARFDGTASARITYGAYGSGPLPQFNANGNVAAFWVHNASYVTVEDLDLQAPGDGTKARRGIWLLADNGDADGVVLRRLNIHDVRGQMPSTTGGDSFTGKMGGASGGIIVEGQGTAQPSAFNDLLIENNTVTDVDRQGIYFWSNWCRRPEMATFWNTKCSQDWHPHERPIIRGNSVNSVGGDGIVLKTSENGMVEHNDLQDFNMRAGSVNAGIWAANTDDTIFQYNRSAGGNTSGDGQGYDVDHSTDGLIFQYNVSYDNDGGFFLICPYGKDVPGNSKNFIIRYNLSVSDHARTFQVCSGGAVNGQIYNNTIFLPQGGSGTHHIVLENATQDAAVQLNFRNNIFMRHTGGETLAWTTNDPAVVGSNNQFYNVPAPAGFVGSQIGAPLLATPGATTSTPSSYLPNADSPVIGTGIAVPGAPATDFFGTPVGSPPSRGFAER